MRRLGQHFLNNRSAIKKIVGAMELTSGETIVEIGPGHGELTEFLRSANREVQMVLIEKDIVLCDLLREKFHNDNGITIIEGDVLKILPEYIMSNKRLATHEWKLVGNIPYYITGHLLRIVGELADKPQFCVFTIQKEVAERITARPPHMNRLAASIQFWADPEIIDFISKENFLPVPEVDSAIIKLKTKKEVLGDGVYFKTVRILFAQPRQTILNNLYRGLKNKSQAKKISKEELAASLQHIRINPEARPQDLTIEDIVKIMGLNL